MERKKSYVGELTFEKSVYSCSNWKVWPPKEAFLYDGRSAAEARSEMTVEAHHRLSIWESSCGLMRMDHTKCLSCPFVLKDGVSVTRPLAKPAGRLPPRKKNFITR